jgi:putative transposase
MSISRDHGWTIGEDDGTWRHARLRWPQRVKGRKRHILVDTLGLPIATRVEPASISDRVAGERLLAGLGPLFPRIRTVIADAGHQSRKLARCLLRDAGWKLQIVKRGQKAF